MPKSEERPFIFLLSVGMAVMHIFKIQTSLQCKVNYRCIERCKKRNDQSQFSMQMNTIKKTNSVWCADVSMLSLLLFIIIVVV